jgi:hypothetical protein
MSLGVRRLVDLIVLVLVALSAVLVLRIVEASRGVPLLVDLIVLVPVGLIVALRLDAVGLLAVPVGQVRLLRERTMPVRIVDPMVGPALLVGMPPTRTPTRGQQAAGLVAQDLLGVTVGDRSEALGFLGLLRQLRVVTSGPVEIAISPLLPSVLVHPVQLGVLVAPTEPFGTLRS